jgi:hypothetical protein
VNFPGKRRLTKAGLQLTGKLARLTGKAMLYACQLPWRAMKALRVEHAAPVLFLGGVALSAIVMLLGY